MSHKIKEKCRTVCHKECYQIQYSSSVKRTDWGNRDTEWMLEHNIKRETTVQLDSDKAMFQYTEEPVLTFTEYLVYCGGLMGLWFGTSAHDIIVITLDTDLWKNLLKIYRKIIIKINNI